MKRSLWLVEAPLFAAILLGYLSARSAFYNFDGVACAIAVDLSDFKHLVHGNHLAYGPIAWLFVRLWRVLGYAGTALYPMQVLSGLLGAAGAVVFASLLRRAGRSPREAALAALALAFSYAWWFWSLEAQVYMLGALFVALAARAALDEKADAIRVWLWTACAVLGHAGHIMAIPALAWAIKDAPRGLRWKDVVPAVLLLVACYSAAAVFAVKPGTYDEWRLWLLGSAALGTSRAFEWHGAGVAGLRDWARMTLRVFCDFDLVRGAPRAGGVLLALIPLAAAVRGAVAGGFYARFWSFWFAGYALLFSLWEPFTIVYRVPDLIALWALALEGLDALEVEGRPRAAALAVWLALAGLWNWTYGVRPATNPDNNADYAETAWAAARAPEDAWIVAVGRGQVYLPYFAARRPLNLRYLPDESALGARLDVLAARGEAVFVTERSLELSGRGQELARYGLTKDAVEGERTLYRVRRPSVRP